MTYTGAKPYTGGELTELSHKPENPPFPWNHFQATEEWSALVDNVASKVTQSASGVRVRPRPTGSSGDRQPKDGKDQSEQISLVRGATDATCRAGRYRQPVWSRIVGIQKDVAIAIDAHPRT